MRQGIQTNFKHEELRKWGCYFFTLCYWVCEAFSMDFTDDEIIAKFEEYKKRKFIDWQGNSRTWIGDNAFINAPTLIFNDLSNHAGYFTKVDRTTTVPLTKRFPVFFDGKITHFALGQLIDSKVVIIKDSWSPSALERGLQITNYRIFS